MEKTILTQHSMSPKANDHKKHMNVSDQHIWKTTWQAMTLPKKDCMN